MVEVLTTPETALPGGDDVTPPDGEGAGPTPPDVVAIKDVLGEHLGKTFETDEAALKSVKDTFNYVGKVGQIRPLLDKLEQTKGGFKNVVKLIESMTDQDTPPEAPPATPPTPPVEPGKVAELETQMKVLNETVRESQFYSEHPEMKDYKPLIKSLGEDPYKVIEMDVFKETHTKLQAHDEAEKSRTVLASNPRLGAVTDKITKAREAAASGDIETARANAVGAVLDAHPELRETK